MFLEAPNNLTACDLVQSAAMVSSNFFHYSFARHKTSTARRALPVIRQPQIDFKTVFEVLQNNLVLKSTKSSP